MPLSLTFLRSALLCPEQASEWAYSFLRSPFLLPKSTLCQYLRGVYLRGVPVLDQAPVPTTILPPKWEAVHPDCVFGYPDQQLLSRISLLCFYICISRYCWHSGSLNHGVFGGYCPPPRCSWQVPLSANRGCCLPEC